MPQPVYPTQVQAAYPAQAQPADPTPVPAAYPAHAQPADPSEAKILGIIADYAERYAGAQNEMAQGVLRGQRARTLCSQAGFGTSRPAVRDWTGTVTTLSSTGKGNGVLSVRIDENVKVGTTNNEFSETLADFKTLIDPSSPVAEAAVALKKGQKVRFSGVFSRSNTDCPELHNLTQSGAMKRPEFLFRFTAIAPTD